MGAKHCTENPLEGKAHLSSKKVFSMNALNNQATVLQKVREKSTAFRML